MSFHDTYIAGHKHRPGADGRLKVFAPDEPLELEREPTNAYDANAVKVFHGADEARMHVGYIPADLSEDVTALLEGGRFTRCCALKGGGSRGIRVYFDEDDNEVIDLGDNLEGFGD